MRLHCGNPFHELELDNGERIRSRTVIIASGARYRKPALAKLQSLEGAGVYYGATYLESQFCRDQEIAVIGGGNSAGQAAVFLSDTARKRLFSCGIHREFCCPEFPPLSILVFGADNLPTLVMHRCAL